MLIILARTRTDLCALAFLAQGDEIDASAWTGFVNLGTTGPIIVRAGEKSGYFRLNKGPDGRLHSPPRTGPIPPKDGRCAARAGPRGFLLPKPQGLHSTESTKAFTAYQRGSAPAAGATPLELWPAGVDGRDPFRLRPSFLAGYKGSRRSRLVLAIDPRGGPECLDGKQVFSSAATS